MHPTPRGPVPRRQDQCPAAWIGDPAGALITSTPRRRASSTTRHQQAMRSPRPCPRVWRPAPPHRYADSGVVASPPDAICSAAAIVWRGCRCTCQYTYGSRQRAQCAMIRHSAPPAQLAATHPSPAERRPTRCEHPLPPGNPRHGHYASSPTRGAMSERPPRPSDPPPTAPLRAAHCT